MRSIELIATVKRNSGIRTMVGVLLAFYFSIPAINNILTAIVPSLEGISMPLLYLVACFGLVISSVLVSSWSSQKNFYSLFVIFVITAYYVLSIKKTRISPLFFIVYCIVPLASTWFFVEKKAINIKTLLFFCMVFPLVGILVFKKIFHLDVNGSITMGQSYAFLVPVLSNIIYVLFYFRNLKQRPFYSMAILAITAVNAFYSFYLFFYGSRGPIVCILLCLLFFFIFKHNLKNEKIFISKGRLIVSVVGIILFIASFWAILHFLNSFINSQTISKMLRLRDDGDLLNNRSDIYKVAFSSWFERFFFGHGLGTFGFYTGEEYPHNIFLQLVFDGGLFLSIVIIIPSIIGIVRLFNRCTREEYLLFAFLFFGFVIKSLFSGDVWENEKMWVCFGLLFYKAFQVVCRKHSERCLLLNGKRTGNQTFN